MVTDSKDDGEKGVAWENDLNIAGEDATLVLLTDLHHHPSYDAAISAKCLCRADAAGSPRELCKADSAPYGRLGCNAPSSLVDLSLKAAAKEEPQLWLILGDLADHWANQPTDSPYPPKAPGFTTFSDTLRRWEKLVEAAVHSHLAIMTFFPAMEWTLPRRTSICPKPWS